MGLMMHLLGALAAVWVFQDSRKHGHGFVTSLLWAAGVTAFILIFLPLYFLWGRRRSLAPHEPTPEALQDITLEAEAEFVGERIHCPMCANSVREDYQYCPHCGFTLRLQCVKCGRDLQRGWKNCPDCGTSVPEK